MLNPPAALNLQRGQLLIVGTGAISVTFLPSWVNGLFTIEGVDGGLGEVARR